MEQSIFAALAAHGLPGLIIGGLATWVVMLHRELREERHSRIEDAKENFGALFSMQERTLAVGEKLSDVMSELKERDRERDPRRGTR